jgi:hypothetical protein
MSGTHLRAVPSIVLGVVFRAQNPCPCRWPTNVLPRHLLDTGRSYIDPL